MILSFVKPYLLFSLVFSPLAALAQNDPESSTSNNAQVVALPAPGPGNIDGKSNDWDLSAGIWSYNDPTLVEKHSLWTPPHVG